MKQRRFQQTHMISHQHRRLPVELPQVIQATHVNPAAATFDQTEVFIGITDLGFLRQHPVAPCLAGPAERSRSYTSKNTSGYAPINENSKRLGRVLRRIVGVAFKTDNNSVPSEYQSGIN